MASPSNVRLKKCPAPSLAVSLSRSAIASTVLLLAHTAFAVPFVDPIGDFIPSFVGPHNADLM